MRKVIGAIAVMGALVGCGYDPDVGRIEAAHGEVPPPPEERDALCRVTGGGQIEAGDFPDSFGGNAQPFRGDVIGHWNHVTHEGGHLLGDPEFVDCYDAGNDEEPPSAGAAGIMFGGPAIWNGDDDCEFEVDIQDHGEGGPAAGPDFYSIAVFCGGSLVYEAANDLLHGNLQIHAVPPGHMPR